MCVNKNNCLFIFPPNWCTSHPYMSIPCLLPYIRARGYSVQPLDLNIEYYKYTRSEQYIHKCYSKIRGVFDEKLLEKYNMIYDFLISNNEKAYRYMHSLDDFKEMDKYVFLGVYQWQLEYFKEVANANCKVDNSWSSISNLIEFTNDSSRNEYLEFYDSFFEEYEMYKYDTVMVSLAGTQQMLPAMTLCRYLKKKYPNIVIIAGGNPFTKIINRIDNNWISIFEDMIDYIVTHEGEYVLPALLDCINKKGDLSKLNDIIYYKNGNIMINPEGKRVVDIENGYAPSYEGYNLGDYNSPEIILPYYVTRGCYWKKCTFCDHDFGFSDCFRLKSTDKILDDIEIYRDKYGARYIHFVDEAIPPKIIEKLCSGLLERKIDIKWFTCIKASEKFTLDLCKMMKKAGCTFVSIGVESCSQEVLDNMNKGITLSDIDVTLANMKKAGIWAHCFMINNFEGETDRNRWETFVYVNKRKNTFTSIGMGDFTLSKNAKIFPKIKIKQIEEISDFSNDIVYRSETATSKDEAETLHNYYNSLNSTSEFMGRYIFEREHLAIFISEKYGFGNSNWVKREYLNKIQYNKDFLLKKVIGEKLFVYSLKTNEFYILPKQFIEVIEAFDGDIEKLLMHPAVSIFNNKEDIINFLLDDLYV